MKRLATSFLFGRDTRFSGIIAFSIVASIALGCTCAKSLDFGNTGSSSNSTPASNTFSSSNDAPSGVPSDSALQSMIKETTADFADAINTNDFHSIYEKSSSDFQRTYTEAQMKDTFKDFVAKKRFILPSLNKVSSSTGAFSPAPSIRQESGLDILVLTGKFPTKPLAVKYEYEYVKRDGEWKLLKLVINM